MKIGVMMFPTDKAIQPIELAKETEARGFESLWFPEHSHIPTSRVTPWGGNPKAPPLPEEYWRSHDQFVALAAAAAVTENIKVATGITLVAQRDPLWLAKEVASLDARVGAPRREVHRTSRCVEGTYPRHAGDLEQRRSRIPRRAR
jgi:alkanesulfonate monooxygenase SsuD/methylene tetrahydromethanopterin reductase-like flavin-dependent oxidoreductase (luciferase family)